MLVQAVNVYVCCKVVHFTKESVGTESLLEPVSRGCQRTCRFLAKLHVQYL